MSLKTKLISVCSTFFLGFVMLIGGYLLWVKLGFHIKNDSIYLECNNNTSIIEYDINGKKTYPYNFDVVEVYELRDKKLSHNEDRDSNNFRTYWVLITPNGGRYTDTFGNRNIKDSSWSESNLTVDDKYIHYIKQGQNEPNKSGERLEFSQEIGISRISGKFEAETSNITRYPDKRWTSTRILTKGKCQKGSQKF